MGRNLVAGQPDICVSSKEQGKYQESIKSFGEELYKLHASALILILLFEAVSTMCKTI